MTRALLANAAAVLGDAGIENPQREAKLLLAHILMCAPAKLMAQTVRPEQAAQFHRMVDRRVRHEPFAYITGTRGFWTLDLEVTPATLIPRPDTETLIDAALAHVGDRRAPLDILDLGTGTGAILIALLSELPNATGQGVDVSREALSIAERNALRAGVGIRARFAISSWWSHVSGSFDLIVSNPPYIPSADIAGLEPDVRDFEPHLALDGGPDGLAAYRAIATLAPARLNPGGALLAEVGLGQAPDVAAIFAAAGLSDTDIRHDLAGKARVVIARHPRKP